MRPFQPEADDFCVAARSYSSTTETPLHETEKTMHAALVNLTIDPDQAPAAANALTHDILPAIRSAPGFVAGYWLEPVDGHGFSFVVFETEEQARRSAPPASNWAAPGVSINDVDFRRVAASA
ncbi:MAG TPA: hypothetical protein VJL85_03640 [Gaiellaceae bacterium]|nr:hypothetical protein [Gaiellaceae bacterium]